MPKFKLPPDLWADIALELSQLDTLAAMLVEIDVIAMPERVDYFTERLPEHLGRVNKAFQQLYAEHLADDPPPPPENKPEPMRLSEKRALIRRIERAL